MGLYTLKFFMFYAYTNIFKSDFIYGSKKTCVNKWKSLLKKRTHKLQQRVLLFRYNLVCYVDSIPKRLSMNTLIVLLTCWTKVIVSGFMNVIEENPKKIVSKARDFTRTYTKQLFTSEWVCVKRRQLGAWMMTTTYIINIK